MRTRPLLVPSLLLTAALGCRSTEAEGADEAPAVVAAPVPATAPAPPAAAPARAQDGEEEDRGDRLDRVRQRQGYLADEYIRRGDDLVDQGDLEGALSAYASALEIMPSSEEARDRLAHVRTLLGEDADDMGQVVEEGAQRETVRRAQTRLSAERFVSEGDRHVAAGAFSAAVESYRRARNLLRLDPTIATGALSLDAVEQKLVNAQQLAAQEGQRRTERQEAAAIREREAREREQQQYRETRLRTLYSQANAAFHREQYGLAETLAEQILLYDPGNETAIELRDIAQAARHRKREARTRREYRENWIRTFEELELLSVPQTDTLVFDDLARWREVSQRKPYEFSEADVAVSSEKEAVLRRLEDTRVPARFGEEDEGAPLEEVANFLQNVTGVNFVISATVRDELDEDETSIYLDLPDRSVRQLLDIITEVRENLRWKIEDGVVKFVTPEETTGGQVLRMYEVRDLIRPIPDYPGREINVTPQGGYEFDEDFDERETLVITEDSLDALIRDHVARDSWDEDVANSLRISNGTLVVNQTPEVHGQIRALLDDLREATSIMVDIQSRFLKVEDNFLEDIGVDFRGLGSPGLGTNEFFNDFGDPTAQQTIGQEIGTDTDLGAFFDDGEDGDVKGRVENLYDGFLGDEDVLTGSGGLSFQWTYLNDLQLEMILRAVSKSERVELVTAPRVVVFNTGRSNLTVLNQVAYVQDFEVEIAQSASIADPIISVVEDGVILDVRPIVSADRRFITLELRPTVAELRRPIGTFTTSLAVSDRTVTIQLPELEISRVRTSVPMPDGGTVLLGGFKVRESQDFRSGVPILNRIPLLSFLFERKGTFISSRKLLILLKAQIVIPEEREPSASQLGLDSELAFGRR